MGSLDAVIKKGDETYGKGTFIRGSDSQMDFPRIPTGIFSLDYMLGGGFPIGVTSCVWGPPGGGKTLVITRIGCGAQSICWSCYDYLWDCKCKKPREQKVVIVQTELFDMGFAKSLGLNDTDVFVAEASSGEQASDIIAECLRADDCGLVVLDSLAMLTPTAELEASALDVQMAAQAKLITKLIRRTKSILVQQKKKLHPTTFVCTNQVRAKIGGFGFGPQEMQPGGHASQHDWHLSLRMSQLKSESKDKETELPINAKFKASMIAMGNKRKIFTLAGSSEFYVTVSDGGAHLTGAIPDHNVLVKYAKVLVNY